MNSLKAKIMVSDAARSLKAGRITQEEFDKIQAEATGTAAAESTSTALPIPEKKPKKADLKKAKTEGE